jgi:hypothetical protein
VTSTDADVYRIPGVLLSDPGLAYVVGKPGREIHLTIRALDVTFMDGSTTKTVRLDGQGIARVDLRTAGA